MARPGWRGRGRNGHHRWCDRQPPRRENLWVWPFLGFGGYVTVFLFSSVQLVVNRTAAARAGLLPPRDQPWASLTVQPMVATDRVGIALVGRW